MPPAARTLSATEFAEITGVSRERLRTWERRHDFPEPVRVGRGARRYRVDDVPRVVAVRRSVERGVPVEAAIAAAREQTTRISDAVRASLAENAPVAIVVLSGPEPLRVEEVNAVVRARPGAPSPGDDLLDLAPWYGEHDGYETLRRLFAGSSMAAGCEHPDWTNGLAGTANGIAYRLPQLAGHPPLVAIVGVDTARERRLARELAAARETEEELRARIAHSERWSRATSSVVAAAREQGGAAALSTSADVLVRQAGVLDAAVAPYMTGSLVLGRSSRGLLGPAAVTVSAHEDLGSTLRGGTPQWLGERARAAVGAPDGLAVRIVPVLAAGEALAALLLLFDAQEDLAGVPDELLMTISTVLGFVLVRERVMGELGDARPR